LHAAQADIDYLDDVRFLRDEDVTRQTLVRMASLWQAQVCDDRENRRRLEARVETSTAQIRKLESTLNEVSDASAWHAAQAQRWQDEYHAAVAVYEGALELAHVARRTQAVTEYPPGQASAPTGKDWLWIAANPLLATKLAVLKRIDRLSVRSPRASSALRSTVRHTWWLMTLQWGRSTKEQDLVPARHRGQADERDQKPTADREKKKLGAPLEITVAPHKQGAPLVSIVIPCFNYGRFIKEAVSSAAAQTFKDLEIIVVEGGSTDGTTRKVVQTLSGPNLNVLFRNQAHRVGDNRNFGIAHARGKYICCLDADDRLHPTYIEKAVYMLERHGYDLISTSVQMFGESELRYGVSDEVDLEVLMQANPITTCALFRRDLWEAAGGFRDYGDGTPATHLHEDWGFWMRLAALGARMTNFSRDHLFYYRVHGTPSLSRNPDILPMDQQGQALRDANADILTKKALLRSKHRRFTPVHVSDGLVNLVRKPWKPNARTMLMALPFTVLGGAERLLSAVVRHLTKAGWDISIIKSIEPAKAAGDTTEWFSASTAQIYDLPKFLAEDNWNDFIDYLIQTKGVSKVWIIGSEFVYHLLPTLKRKYPGLLCVDLLFNTVGHTANNRRYATLIDRILVENNEVQSWLVERGENPSRITTITSGVNLTEFKPREKSLSLLQALAIKPSGLLVGFSGRWSDEKDPIAFVRIAARLVNLAPLDDVYFIMTGTGPLKRAILKELATLPELNNRFHIMENVSDIRDVLASFDVLVLPSRLDGRPVVVLEALASGVPVVASRVGALPELIDPGRTGELCDPGDYDGFAAALAGVNENRRLLQQMKRNARAFAEQYLDEQDMLERYRHALEAVEPHPLTKPSEGGITT
jgi:glycosyltransferase involved in cell wall biosynthesis